MIVDQKYITINKQDYEDDKETIDRDSQTGTQLICLNYEQGFLAILIQILKFNL